MESKRVRAEYEEVFFYQQNPVVFTQYLAQVAIKTTFIGSFVQVFANLFDAIGNGLFMLGDVSPVIRSLARDNTFFFVSQIVYLISAILIVGICRPAMRLWRQVRHFEAYQATVPEEIRNSVDIRTP
jgi:hypothetical protein